VIDAISAEDPLAWNGKHEIFCPVSAEGWSEAPGVPEGRRRAPRPEPAAIGRARPKSSWLTPAYF